MNANRDIWVLGDDRPGNTNQAIALAQELGHPYTVKYLQYNKYRLLPNWFLAKKPLHVNKDILQALLSCPAPGIIISSGRRMASLAVYLKKYFRSDIKIIQIMNPCLDFKNFDSVILPQHDKIRQITPNIIRIVGALTNIHSRLDQETKILEEHYPEIKNFIAVIIGGSSRQFKFNTKDVESFSQILQNIAKNQPLPFFISFSRRTPAIVKEIIMNNFAKWPNVIYDPSSKKPNPYVGLLGQAKYVIVTADSISMCSEAASSGKPLYIFYNEDFNLRKHRFFIQQLMDLGIAKKLDESVNFLQEYHYKPLHEVRKVAELVAAQIGL